MTENPQTPKPAGEKATVGAVYRDLLEWSADLPRWQQELLRRVLLAEELSEADIVELAKAAVADSEQQPASYRRLSETDFPSIAAEEERRTLLGLRDLRNVNALRSGQTLAFGPQLTVVYGDNASGKSGYARVLKKVYRARVVEDILSNVRSETLSAERPSGTFVVKVVGKSDVPATAEEPMGSEECVEWVDGEPASGIGRFAVLDGACSLTYVRGGVLAVGPAGIDVPRRFAEELVRVKGRLAAQATASLPDKSSLKALENDTASGRFVAGLSSTTNDQSLAAAARWTPEMARELRELEEARTAAKAEAPAARRARLKARLSALESIGRRLAGWSDAVAQQQIDALLSISEALADANAMLDGLRGMDDRRVPADVAKGRPWLDLLEAAARFVDSIDRHSHAVGPMSIDGQCSLCWQPLDDDARRRLERFNRHLEGTAVKTQREVAARREGLLGGVKGIPDAMTPEDNALLASEEGLTEGVASLLDALKLRRDRVLAQLSPTGVFVSSAALKAMPPIDEACVIRLRELYVSARAQLASVPTDESAVAAHVQGLEKRILSLTTQRGLSERIEDARAFVTKAREHQSLRNAEAGINTRATSTKAAELHAKHMTDRYARLVDDELRELRFRRLRPTLAQKTSRAKVEVAPVVSAELKHIPPERVFSEGERTAIALACFLAEIRLGDDPSGLIFDDPVSSFDHSVREQVARRLVGAAKERQVIVFTHDLAFLADLREQTKNQIVDCRCQTLSATDFDTGFVEDEEPFGARNVKRRIGRLREVLVNAERAARDGRLEEVRTHGKDFYESLRSTWERFIEERLFSNVVRRLERNVMPGALPRVSYSKELGEMVHEGWRRCSSVIEAHDHAPATGGQSYSIAEMKADLEMLVEAEERAPAH